MSYSTAICNRIISTLESDDWKYRLDTEKELIKTGISLNNKLQHVDVVIDLRDDKYLLYMLCPLYAEESERREVAVLLNLINYTTLSGNLEMDPKDGQIRYRCTVDCDNCLPSREVIMNGLYRGANTFQKFGNAIIQVMMGFGTAQQAFDAANQN